MNKNSSVWKLIAILGHPVWIPTIASIVYYKFIGSEISTHTVKQVIAIIAANTLIIPLVTVLVLIGLGWAKSIMLETKKERIIPIIASMTFYFWTFYVVKNLGISPEIITLTLAGFISLILSVFAGMKMKPSLHMIGWGVAFSWSIAVNYMHDWEFVWVILCTGSISAFIAYSRHVLKSHDWKEIITGFIIGIVSTIIAYISIA